MKELIKQYFKGYSKKSINKNFLKFLRNNPEVEKYLNDILTENPNWENIKNIVYSICFDEQLKHCKNCGTEMKYSKRNYDYCTYKCRSSSKEVQEKVKQTCIEIYGCENPMQNKDIQEKVKQTNLKNYNTEYTFQSKEFKRLNYYKVYNKLIPEFIEQNVSPLFPKEEYTGYDKIYRWKCDKCGAEFEQKIKPTNHNKNCQRLPRCWKCNSRMSGESKDELELFDFIKELAPNVNVRQHDRTIVGPKELDIVIDELKLAIEFDGDYWHSSEHWLENHNNLDEYYGYHLNKTIEANKKGYRLIHISENDWINNPENIKKKLIDIYQNKEDLIFTEDKIVLDRSWYNNIEIPGYKLVEEIPPEIDNKNGYNVENCGYLVYIKNI